MKSNFGKTSLTHNAAHYLVAINQLVSTNGYARLTDIAKAIDISPGSCLTTLKKLKKRGWVNEDENKFYKLSPIADSKVILINKNKELIKDFLGKILDVSSLQAEKDAGAIEHLLSLESSFKLARLMSCISNGSKASEEFLKEFKKEKYVCWKAFSLEAEKNNTLNLK